MTGASTILHAGLVARRKNGLWKGVLLIGASGAGKSDLALRLVERGWRLVADDRVLVWVDDDRRYGRAPPSLSGLIELRGQGVLSDSSVLAYCEIVLVIACGEGREPLERTPLPQHFNLEGLETPLHHLQPLEASAPARILSVFERL